MRLAAKLGFTEVERLQAYGAEQWFGMCSPVKPHLPAVYAVPRWRGCVRKDQHFSVGGDP